MSEITQNERGTEDVQPRFALDRGQDEPSGNWLQRVLFQPLEGFDVGIIKEKLMKIGEQRDSSKAGECILPYNLPLISNNSMGRTRARLVITLD
jgi:hypothetical protein